MRTLAEVDRDLVAALRDYLESYASHLPVRTVAVVGNAPLEPSVERQTAIDSADLVFRCNSLVLDGPGEEPCLGTKTDVVVADRHARITPWFFQDYDRRAYLIVDAGSVRRPHPRPAPPAWWPDDVGAWLLPNRLVGLPLRRYMRPESAGAGVVPTTGTVAAYVARSIFPDARTLLTGFSYIHEQAQEEWSHHWGDVSPVHSSHLLDREGELLQSWIDEGVASHLP